jgi:ABC-2 type transport system ATP-binding protein
MALLEVQTLSKSWGSRAAVNAVSFAIAAGECVALLGPNGAGKSTTMRMIAGRLLPDSGDVRIDGASIVAARTRAQAKLGYLPEGAPLYGDLSVRAFLEFCTSLHGLSGTGQREAIARAAEAASIAEVLNRRIRELSKGYRRRVALAGAVAHAPAVVVLDEPTDGLDPVQKRTMRAWLDRFRKDRAVIISTHQLEEAEAMCPRAIVLAQGQVLADEPMDDLVRRGGLERAFLDLTASAAA